MTDRLTAEGIENHLKYKERFNISAYDYLASTNNTLKEKALLGEKEGMVIIAESQSEGRGRYARKFHSPHGNGIYMSILLKPDLPAEKAVLITAVAAAAVSKAVETISGKLTQIKWVNDVLIDNKKICGILTEGGINPKTAKFDWAVVGIGVNAYVPENGFESEIIDIAGAVFDKKETDLRNRLAAEILNYFWDYYSSLDDNRFFNDYKSRMINLGREIKVIKGDSERKAKCLDLDDNCRLLVDYGEGMEYLSSGEISIKINA